MKTIIVRVENQELVMSEEEALKVYQSLRPHFEQKPPLGMFPHMGLASLAQMSPNPQLGAYRNISPSWLPQPRLP